MKGKKPTTFAPAASTVIKARTIRKSQSKRAGLILPVSRIHRRLKQLPQAPKRISKGASVYLTSVIEYLIGKYYLFRIQV